MRTKQGTIKSAVAKRSIAFGDRKTSVSLEQEFWGGLREIAARRNTTLARLVARIDAERGDANLSSAIRVYVLEHLRAQAHGRQPPG